MIEEATREVVDSFGIVVGGIVGQLEMLVVIIWGMRGWTVGVPISTNI